MDVVILVNGLIYEEIGNICVCKGPGWQIVLKEGRGEGEGDWVEIDLEMGLKK